MFQPRFACLHHIPLADPSALSFSLPFSLAPFFCMWRVFICPCGVPVCVCVGPPRPQCNRRWEWCISRSPLPPPPLSLPSLSTASDWRFFYFYNKGRHRPKLQDTPIIYQLQVNCPAVVARPAVKASEGGGGGAHVGSAHSAK